MADPIGEDAGPMSRRVLLILASVLLLGAVVGAMGPRENQAVKPDLPAGRPAGTDRTVRGTLPREKVVRARVGDLVELTVVARAVDSATIEGFAQTEAVAPGAPARFSLLADRAGSFPVTLVLSGDRAGRIVVAAP
jgi:hypothetical protein